MKNSRDRVLKKIIGKSLEEARKIAEAGKFSIRIVSLDGKSTIGDCSLNMDRLNVSVNNGLITSVDVG